MILWVYNLNTVRELACPRWWLTMTRKTGHCAALSGASRASRKWALAPTRRQSTARPVEARQGANSDPFEGRR